MKFDELDVRMRVFETAHDHCVLPGIHIVCRLDGHGFTRLTRETHPFEAPFDVRFRDLMVGTVRALMDANSSIVYGYTESDEISVLFRRDADDFGRKERKLNSILAAEASAAFTLALGAAATFDCRVCQLPTADLVRDYFRWRQEDAHRNALSSHCYWIQRKEGASVKDATARLMGMTTAQKNEFLFQRGVNYDTVPSWQKRGVGVVRETYEIEGRDPRTGATSKATRRRLRVIEDSTHRCRWRCGRRCRRRSSASASAG
ncbi:MAG: guanylyltransferase [Planctomycetes bacterium]|nr:guanylyltransferase [Planctomycetota bacterium]